MKPEMTPEQGLPVSEEMLRQAGLRVTPQRLTVLDILRSEPELHLDAAEIYRKADQWAPSISLASVYRALAALKEAGLVHETVVDAGYHRYGLRRPTQDAYVLCGDCERVIELDSPVVQQLRAELARRHFRVDGVEIRLSGRCDGLRSGCEAAGCHLDHDEC